MVNRVRLPRSVVHVFLVLAMVAGQIGPLPVGGASQVAAAPQAASPALAPSTAVAPSSVTATARSYSDTSVTPHAGLPQLRPLSQTLSYQDEVMADGPLGYWRLGETSGTTAYDASGNGHNGTIVGNVTRGQPGAILSDSDTAMSFSGGWPKSQYISVPVGFSDFSNGLTLEAWVYPTAAANNGHIIYLGNADGTHAISLFRHLTYNHLDFKVCNGSSCSILTAPNLL